MKSASPNFYHLKTILLLLGALTMNRCGDSSPLKSGDISEDRIFRSYTVTYSDSDKATNVLARFNEAGPSGSSVTLSGPSSISVEDSALRLSGVAPEKYSDGSKGYGWLLKESREDASYLFSWITPKNRSVADRIHLPEPVELKLESSVLSRSRGARVQFNRNVRETNATVTVTINGFLEGTSTKVSVVGSVNNGDHIDFQANDLQKLSLTKLNLKIEMMEQRDLPAISEGAVGGRSTALYLTREYPFDLDP